MAQDAHVAGAGVHDLGDFVSGLFGLERHQQHAARARVELSEAAQQRRYVDVRAYIASASAKARSKALPFPR